MVKIELMCLHNYVNGKTMKTKDYVTKRKTDQTVRKQSVYKLQKELFNMSKVKRQKKLGFFKFTKTFRHRGVKVNVEISDEVEDDSKTVPFDVCKNLFFITQGLKTHKLSCEKKCSDLSKPSSTITSATVTNHATKISVDILSTQVWAREGFGYYTKASLNNTLGWQCLGNFVQSQI